jgi:diacylglycerol kinase family enzyme
VTTSTTTRRTFLRALPKVFKGTHVDEPSVSVRTASSVELDADRPFRVFADGDPIASLPCTVTVRPGALRVLLPVRGTA